MVRTLVIEDRLSLLRLYQTVLGQRNHDVAVAPAGEAGLGAASRGRPDLVIMDLLLPGLTGAEVAQKLTEAGILPAAPLIVTTGLPGGEARAIAVSMGASALLVKPFDMITMLALVDEVLSKSGQQPTAPQAKLPPTPPYGPHQLP